MPRVDWSSPKATWAAVARRRAVRRDSSRMGGVNIATFLWSDGSTTYATTRWLKAIDEGIETQYKIHDKNPARNPIKRDVAAQTVPR